MVKVVDGKHYMIGPKHSQFRLLVFKVQRFYNYDVKVSSLFRTLTFNSPEECSKCYDELYRSEGVILERRGRKLKVYPYRTVELVD